MKGVTFYKDSKSNYRWRVVANNGYDIVAEGGEGYINKMDAVAGFIAATKVMQAALQKNVKELIRELGL
jgi:uncharacterized protein YegP (UPF0339 family)